MIDSKIALCKKNKLFFKKKELKIRAIISVLKNIHKLKNKKTSYIRYKLFSIDSFLLHKDLAKSFKGYSIITNRRKAFYSLFQISRFEIKRLTSEKILTGVQSAIW